MVGRRKRRKEKEFHDAAGDELEILSSRRSHTIFGNRPRWRLLRFGFTSVLPSPTTLPSLALTLCPKGNAIHAQPSMSISLHETFPSSKYDHSSRLCPLGAFYQTATPPSPLPSVPGPMATPKNPASFVQRTPISPSLRYNRRAAYRRETVILWPNDLAVRSTCQAEADHTVMRGAYTV